VMNPERQPTVCAQDQEMQQRLTRDATWRSSRQRSIMFMTYWFQYGVQHTNALPVPA